MPYLFWPAESPAVNSSESPGRKNPMSSPDSANTMRKTPIIPNFSMSAPGSSSPPAANSTMAKPRPDPLRSTCPLTEPLRFS